MPLILLVGLLVSLADRFYGGSWAQKLTSLSETDSVRLLFLHGRTRTPKNHPDLKKTYASCTFIINKMLVEVYQQPH